MLHCRPGAECMGRLDTLTAFTCMVAPPMTNTTLTLLSTELIKRYYAAGHWRDDTIYALVRDHARRAPDKPALRDRARDESDMRPSSRGPTRWQPTWRRAACGRASACWCGCRAGSRAWWRCSPARATAMCAVPRSIAITRPPRSSSSCAAPARPPSSGRPATAPTPRDAISLPSLAGSRRSSMCIASMRPAPINVMAGLVPAIHVFAKPARRGCPA